MPANKFDTKLPKRTKEEIEAEKKKLREQFGLEEKKES